MLRRGAGSFVGPSVKKTVRRGLPDLSPFHNDCGRWDVSARMSGHESWEQVNMFKLRVFDVA